MRSGRPHRLLGTYEFYYFGTFIASDGQAAQKDEEEDTDKPANSGDYSAIARRQPQFVLIAEWKLREATRPTVAEEARPRS